MSDPEPTAIPNLPPEEAIAIFRGKGLAKSFDWRDVWKAEHGRAFTVAKMMSTALLEDTREIIDAGLAEGKSFGQIAGELKTLLRSSSAASGEFARSSTPTCEQLTPRGVTSASSGSRNPCRSWFTNPYWMGGSETSTAPGTIRRYR
jgi:uncharacterized protein with gpF-like domain